MNTKVILICVSIVGNFTLQGMSPEEELLKGAQEGSLTTLENALVRGAQLEAKDDAGRTALHRVILGGHSECTKLLLEKGAQIDVADQNGMTALYCAAREGKLESLGLLLEKGAQMDTQDVDDSAELQLAASYGHIECFKALLLAKVYLVIDEGHAKILSTPKAMVDLSKRRLKVALLSLRYAGATSDRPKLINGAGDFIVSNEYVRSWVLLSDRGLREDVLIVLMHLFAEGKKVDYPLFRMAQDELGDHLLMRLEYILRRNKLLQVLLHEGDYVFVAQQAAIQNLCDPDLVEENFGAFIRNGIKARFNELLRNSLSQASTSTSHSSSSSQNSSSTSKQYAATSR